MTPQVTRSSDGLPSDGAPSRVDAASSDASASSHDRGQTQLLGLEIETRSDGSKAEPQSRGSSLTAGVANLANTILGAGMLGLPHAFAEAGFVPGTLMLFIFGAFSSLGLHLLSEAADRTGRPSTFYAVAEAAQPGAGLVIDVAIAIKCFGVGTSYLIVVGDSMPKAIAATGVQGGLLIERRLWTFIAAALVSPLAYCKRIDALKYTSAFALACVLFVVLLIFLFAIHAAPAFEACDNSPPTAPPMPPPTPALLLRLPPSSPALQPEPPCRLPTVGSTSPSPSPPHPHTLTPALTLILTPTPTQVSSTSALHVLRSVPIFVFAYTCHQNIISITNELHSPTPPRVLHVIGASALVALGVYLLISFSGYTTFGPQVESDILATYPSSAMVAVARVAISVVVTFSYPLQSHPSRTCILSLLAAVLGTRGPRWETAAHLGVTTGFLGLSTAIALVVDDLGMVLSLVGATGSTIVSYILPGATYFLLCRDAGAKRYLGLLQLAIGLVLVPLSLTLIVQSRVGGGH